MVSSVRCVCLTAAFRIRPATLGPIFNLLSYNMREESSGGKMALKVVVSEIESMTVVNNPNTFSTSFLSL